MGRHHTHSGLSFLALAAAPQFPWDPREDLQEALKGGTYRVPSTRFPSTRHAFTLGEGLLVLGSLCVLWDCVAAALVWWAGLWGCKALRTCDPGSCRSVAVVRGTGEGVLGGLLLVCAASDGQVQPERADSWVAWTPARARDGGGLDTARREAAWWRHQRDSGRGTKSMGGGVQGDVQGPPSPGQLRVVGRVVGKMKDESRGQMGGWFGPCESLEVPCPSSACCFSCQILAFYCLFPLTKMCFFS